MESTVPPILQVRKLTRAGAGVTHGQQPHDSVIAPVSLPVSNPHHEGGMHKRPS